MNVKMLLSTLLLPIVTTLPPTPVFAATCETTPAPRHDTSGDLTLHGTGTARYLFFKVFDATLYAPAGAADVAASPKLCLELCYHRTLEADVLAEAAEEVLSQQNGSEHLSRLTPQIRSLHDAYRPVSRGDRYRLCRDAGKLSLAINDEHLISIDHAAFARAYMNIWLGEQPLSESLRDDLLRNDGRPWVESANYRYQ